MMADTRPKRKSKPPVCFTPSTYDRERNSKQRFLEEILEEYETIGEEIEISLREVEEENVRLKKTVQKLIKENDLLKRKPVSPVTRLEKGTHRNYNNPEMAPLTHSTPIVNMASHPVTPLENNMSSLASRSETSAIADMTRLLLKKDLFFASLVEFDDRADTYQAWKRSFCSKMKELTVTAEEEVDLLVRWTGPLSREYVKRIRASYYNDVTIALKEIWTRLDERFGSPETTEAILKAKLDSFPKLTGQDIDQLYDLSDLLAEINALKNTATYATTLAYFDSATGINPIVRKLPPFIQEKWTNLAFAYIKKNEITFPPFAFFCEFVKDQAKMRNNSSFHYAGPNEKQEPKGSTLKVQVRKSEVDEVGFDHCALHSTSNHSTDECRQFRAKPLDIRRKILREKNLCYRCCKPGHTWSSCVVEVRCVQCDSDRHTSAMHLSPRPDHGGEESVSTACSKVCEDFHGGKSCAKVVPAILRDKNDTKKKLKIYALIDDQSNRSLVSPAFFKKFPGNYAEYTYTLSSCSGKGQTSGRRVDGFILESLDGSISYDLPTLIECAQIPNNRDEIPAPGIAASYSHLQPIVQHIPRVDESAPIMLLVGRDLPEAHHITEQLTGPQGSPFAQRLGLGWVIVGETCLDKVHRPDDVSVCKTHILGDGRGTIFQPCPNEFTVQEDDIFTLTKSDNKLGLSMEDEDFFDIMENQCFQNNNGDWVAPLPFRFPRPQLPNNRAQALKRAHFLDRNLTQNDQKKKQLSTFMDGVLEKHAEIAPPLKPGEECWYLPLFGVYNSKKPDKIRGVFDSSAQHEGLSLNNVLLKGPDMTNSLLGILMRFRMNPVAVCGDIEQMFYCFHVAEEHRNFLRFFWYQNGDTDQPLMEYRMCKHVFGNSPSPAVATFCLRKAVRNSDDDVKEFVTTNFYVDDGLTSCVDSSAAVSLLKRTKQALWENGNIRFHKFVSNDQEVLDSFQSSDLSKESIALDTGRNDSPLQRSLGLYWNPTGDYFTFVTDKDIKPYTKRGMLSTVNSLFDPLGFAAPVTIRGKLLLREVVGRKLDWDEPIPGPLRVAWDKWMTDLLELEKLRIPRCYHSFNPTNVKTQELPIFSDASEKAIASVAYLRTINVEGEDQTGFVFGKAKVAPKQGHTIPRLELCACVLAVEIAETICKELSIPVESVYYYTDSKVVLGYLSNRKRRFFIYVGNRVSRILRFSKPEQWSYIPTEENPADKGTRDVPSNMLDNCWQRGIQRIPMKDQKSGSRFDLVNPDQDQEVRPDINVYKTDVDKPRQLGMHRIERFSSLSKLTNAIAFLQHVSKGFQLKKNDKCYGWHLCSEYKTLEARKNAETYLLKEVQSQHYSMELNLLKKGEEVPKSSSLAKLSPVIDNDGLVRVGGRLKNSNLRVEEQHPVLLPGKHHLSYLVTKHFHEEVFHQGRHITEGAIRSAGFWITGGKQLISRLIHHCVICRKLRGSLGFQKMSDLPADRLQPEAPFTSVGVDCFGPWEIVTRRTRGGAANSKCWAVMFTCLTSRAIHIEVVEEMSSSSFINAVRRLIAIRGKVKTFRSDRGTNFIGSTDALGIDVEGDQLKSFLTKNGVKWIFNPPYSSHMGGVWERMIGMTRRILDAILLINAKNHLTHEVLVTFLAEVSAIVNSRPLVPLTSDPENPYPLSPAMILTHKCDHVVSVTVESKDLYRAQWKRVQLLAEMFWKRWQKEYLQSLQERRKWKVNSRNFREGDVVLVKDKDSVRGHWPMGLITKAIPSEDSKIRTVEVKVANQDGSSVYLRPVVELVLLVPNDL